MRSLSALLFSGITTFASAQLINGSFENNGNPDLTGWTSLCNTMSSSPDVPGGTGSWSITMPQIDHWTCPQDYVYQYLPFVHCGDVWTLSAWARTDAAAQLGMVIGFTTRNGGMFESVASGFGTDQTIWSHASSALGIWCDQGDSVFLVLDAGNLFPDSTYGNVWFDDITLTPVSTSSGSFDAPRGPSFRPNPATDKLWVDLQDVPLSITANDATGRSHALQNFQHTSHTLEVDVSALPSGVNLLRIVTGSGTHTIRFIKT